MRLPRFARSGFAGSRFNLRHLRNLRITFAPLPFLLPEFLSSRLALAVLRVRPRSSASNALTFFSKIQLFPLTTIILYDILPEEAEPETRNQKPAQPLRAKRGSPIEVLYVLCHCPITSYANCVRQDRFAKGKREGKRDTSEKVSET